MNIIPEINVANVARAYEVAKLLVKEAYDKLEKADQIFKETFGNHTYISAMPSNYHYSREGVL